ncbi:MAG: hypothetical protein CVU98_02860 [Firmicutes bacterium HGW-Firmicutes-3]|jgi:predicted murein hydrolase (TIGR00659 family)|nr:MAG: hypothetical protein CVU98_02860 [Firmicutes bacterium HGW-Firmicutes-3]
MKDILCNSSYFGVVISLIGYSLGVLIKKKLKHVIFNPLVVSIFFVITILLVFGIDYNDYSKSTQYISFFLTPATVCLAIPLYIQIKLLKKNFKAIILGILTGVLSSLVSVFVLSYFFGFTHQLYITMLPKSITTAIAMDLVGELGGIKNITVVVVILTGIVGNIMCESICRLFKITNPIAVGLAIGTSSHAMGTAKALEIGRVEGAMSSLAIVVSGLLTVVLINIFTGFL